MCAVSAPIRLGCSGYVRFRVGGWWGGLAVAPPVVGWGGGTVRGV